jgi:hypothetical protein
METLFEICLCAIMAGMALLIIAFAAVIIKDLIDD